MRRSGGKHPRQVDPHSELAAGFLMLATSSPADIPAREICIVYRLRRQIELALKSLLNIDRLPTHTEAASLSWLYPHLIRALLTDDICQEILAASSGSCRRCRCALAMVNPGRHHRLHACRIDAAHLYVGGFDTGQTGSLPTPRQDQTATAKDIFRRNLILTLIGPSPGRPT